MYDWYIQKSSCQVIILDNHIRWYKHIHFSFLYAKRDICYFTVNCFKPLVRTIRIYLFIVFIRYVYRFTYDEIVLISTRKVGCTVGVRISLCGSVLLHSCKWYWWSCNVVWDPGRVTLVCCFLWRPNFNLSYYIVKVTHV